MATVPPQAAKAFHSLLRHQSADVLESAITWAANDEKWNRKLNAADTLHSYFASTLTYIIAEMEIAQSESASPGPEPLWNLEEMIDVASTDLPQAQVYFKQHQVEYEKEHPEWLDEFEWRGILDGTKTDDTSDLEGLEDFGDEGNSEDASEFAIEDLEI
jgi:hypothetical protein